MNADVLTNTIDRGSVFWTALPWMTEDNIKETFMQAINQAGMAFDRGDVRDEYVLIAATGDAIRIMESLPDYTIEAPQQQGDFVRIGHLQTRPVLTGPVGFLEMVLVSQDLARRCTVKMAFS